MCGGIFVLSHKVVGIFVCLYDCASVYSFGAILVYCVCAVDRSLRTKLSQLTA